MAHDKAFRLKKNGAIIRTAVVMRPILSNGHFVLRSPSQPGVTLGRGPFAVDLRHRGQVHRRLKEARFSKCIAKKRAAQ
jgi:hypothetical protein